ncbi:MAG TPA: hypothetical protein VME20_11740 [Acidimicrobiales bacterium]|nr:hypothetical protein [Acidimicrobiales bacterium]
MSELATGYRPHGERARARALPDEVPDTLVLEERAELAMNAVAGLLDPGWEAPFFSANLAARPAYLRHGDWDYGSSHGRLTDACILARHMSGTARYLDVEHRLKRGLLGYFGEDGLSYRRRNPRGHWEPNANLIDQRAVILALTTWFLDEPSDEVRSAADRHVAALRRIAVKERDVWYYPASEYTARGWPSANAVQLHLAPDPASFCGRLIMPLLRYHQATGNEDALELCLWFARLIVDKSGVFQPDGSFNNALAYRSGHFHTRLGTLDGLARLALHVGDHSLTEFVRHSFDWALNHATRFGWTPGDLGEQRFEHETCSLVDLIGIATTLARAGHQRYWGTVERFVRNHLCQSQLMEVSWVESAHDTSSDVEGWLSYFNVGERVRGAFAGYGAPNDYVSDVPLGRGHTSDVQACCVGSGVRGLFTCWNNIVSGDAQLLHVNLLLSRGGHLVDVSSYLPFSGQLDVHVRQDLKELHVRLPEWAGYAAVRASIDDEDRSATSDRVGWAADGCLAVVAPLREERVSVRFPLPEHETLEEAAGQRFVVQWRGDNVATISPPGRYRPMYCGLPVAGPAPLRTRRYHVPEKELPW